MTPQAGGHAHHAATHGATSSYSAYQWVEACGSTTTLSVADCKPGYLPCAAGQTLWIEYGLQGNVWQHITSQCRGNGSGKPPVPRPQVTPGLVAQAFARIPLPTYASISQPAGKTLVNFDTIFYAKATSFTRTITLLGQRVELQIAPRSYRWDFGDGTRLTTTVPGAPYPSKQVVHRYEKAHVTVSHRVTVVWGATFRLNGGPAQPVPGTVTKVGPATRIRISEATPVLSGQGH